jgi:penicillin-binding protein 1B
MMTHLMATVVNGGTASRARAMGLKGDAAGKTGTSRDGWFVGYTPNLLCAVWVGFDDNRDLDMTGSESALPIWVEFMKRSLELRPSLGGAFSQPAGLTTAVIDPTTGFLASDGCPGSVRMFFISGTEPFVACNHGYDSEELLSEELNSDTEEVSEDELLREVAWDVCSETGLLPSPSCAVLKKTVFDFSDLPTRVCRPEFHGKGNP